MEDTHGATNRSVHRLLLTARGLRGFLDGLISISIPAYLSSLGFSALEIGTIITATLIGASLLSLATGFLARYVSSRPLFLLATMAMAASGAAYTYFDTFVPLLVVALMGAINPSSSDINMTAPLEQTRLSAIVSGNRRTKVFSHYTLIGSLATAFGVLAASLPQFAATAFGMPLSSALKGSFVASVAIAFALLLLYSHLPDEPRPSGDKPLALGRLRGILPKLSAVFALDAFGGGFVIQSILAIWLFERFGASLTAVASIMFAAGMASSLALLLAPVLARRFGLMNTMIYTHIPANVALIAVPFMPTLEAAIALLLVRSLLGQMDIPARLAYVMAVVEPHERPVAASITSVVRGLSGALSPIIAGGLLAASSFGWPLLIGGGLKLAYNALFMGMFRKVPLHENA
jgi:MFS family permease